MRVSLATFLNLTGAALTIALRIKNDPIQTFSTDEISAKEKCLTYAFANNLDTNQVAWFDVPYVDPGRIDIVIL